MRWKKRKEKEGNDRRRRGKALLELRRGYVREEMEKEGEMGK